MPTPQTRATALGRAACAESRGREAALLLALLRHPTLAEAHHETLERVAFAHRDLDGLRGAILSALLDCGDIAALATRVAEIVGEDATERLARDPQVAMLPWAREDAAHSAAAAGVEETLARLAAEAALAREVTEAEHALTADDAAPHAGRLKAAAERAARERAGRLAEDDGDEAHLSNALHDAIAREIWIKKKRTRPPQR